MEKNIELSLLIVTYNAEKYIEKCIKSLLNQKKIDFNTVEILLVDGISEDGTVQLAKNMLKPTEVNWKILENKKKTLAAGWNIGIKNSNGKYIIRPDAHSQLSQYYISKAISKINYPKIAAVGGILITTGQGYIGENISYILSSKYAVGDSYFRNNTLKTDKRTDTVVYGLYKKKIFDEVGLFNENLERNQDIELHKKILKAQYFFITTPEITAVYNSRSNIKGFFKQAFRNGEWVVRSRSGYLRHFIPLIFVIGLIFSYLIEKNLLLIIIIAYFLIISLLMYKDKPFKLSKILLIPLLTFGFHLSYGVGSMKGLFKIE